MTTKFYFTFKIHVLFLQDKTGILLNLTLTLFYQTYISHKGKGRFNNRS